MCVLFVLACVMHLVKVGVWFVCDWRCLVSFVFEVGD